MVPILLGFLVWLAVLCGKFGFMGYDSHDASAGGGVIIGLN